MGDTFFFANSHQMSKTSSSGSRLGMKLSSTAWSSNEVPPIMKATGVERLTKLTASAPMMKLPNTPAPTMTRFSVPLLRMLVTAERPC